MCMACVMQLLLVSLLWIVAAGLRAPGKRFGRASLRASSRTEKLLEDARRLRQEAEELIEAQKREVENSGLFVAPMPNATEFANPRVEVASTTTAKASTTKEGSGVLINLKEQETAKKTLVDKITGLTPAAASTVVAASVLVTESFALEKELLAVISRTLTILADFANQDDEGVVGEATASEEDMKPLPIEDLIASNFGWFGRPVAGFLISQLTNTVAETANVTFEAKSKKEALFKRAIMTEIQVQFDAVDDSDNEALEGLLSRLLKDIETGDFVKRCVERFQGFRKKEMQQRVGSAAEYNLDAASISVSCATLTSRIEAVESQLPGGITPLLAKEKREIELGVLALMDSTIELLRERFPSMSGMIELLSELKAGQSELAKLTNSDTTSAATMGSALQKAGSMEQLVIASGGKMAEEGNFNGTLVDQLSAQFEEMMAANGEVGAASTAERFVMTYFDPLSREAGIGISREGAGKFQADILRDCLTVTSVKLLDGAVIFEGSLAVKDSAELALRIEEKLKNSSMKDEVAYTIMLSERTPNLDQGMASLALDILLGSTPAVVVFPKSWRSLVATTVNDPVKVIWRNILTSGAILTSAAYAAASLNIFDDNGPLMQNGIFPDDFVLLALAPIMSQSLSTAVEKALAKTKGFEMDSVVVPTLTLPNFGARSTYVTMPKNRNDLFDVAAISSAVAVVNSLALLFYGLSLTASAAQDVLNSYPAISVSLLRTNTVINQVISNYYPGIFVGLSPEVDSTIHVHWLAVVGATMFIANILQLLPIDNSVGSKMYLAVFGRESFELLSIFAGLFKGFFIVPLIFNFGGTAAAASIITKPRLLLDYILSSQLAGSTAQETQMAIDSLSEVTEGRKIAFFGFASLLFYSLAPILTLQLAIDQLFSSNPSAGSSFMTLFK